MSGDVTTPTIVEHDGWTLASGSTSRPSEAELKAQLTGEAVPVVEAPPPVVEEPVAEPVVEEPAAPVVAAPEPAAPVEEPPAAPAPKAGKPKSKVDLSRQRIEQLSTQVATERAKTQQLETELAALRARNPDRPAIPGTEPPAAPVVAAPVAAAVVPAAKPQPIWSGPEGYEAQGKSWDDFQTDHGTWLRESMLAETTAVARRIAEEELAKFRTTDEKAKTQAAEEAARTSAEAAHKTRVDAARAKYADFQSVIDANLEDLNGPFIKHMIFYTADGAELMYHLAHHRDEAEIINDFQPTRPMVDGLRRTRNLIKVMSHLAAHPDEFQRLTTLDPINTLMAIGSLDREVGGAPAGSPPAPRISRAHPPVRPVTGVPQTPAPSVAGAPADLAFGPEYIARENARDRKEHGRRVGAF